MRQSVGVIAALAALVICTAWAPAAQRERRSCVAPETQDICVLPPEFAQTEGSCPAGMLDCSNTDFCCPAEFPMYCAYDQRTGEYNKCMAADTDEDLYYLQNCSYYLQCH